MTGEESAMKKMLVGGLAALAAALGIACAASAYNCFNQLIQGGLFRRISSNSPRTNLSN
jgi:hypothetical protein